MTAAQTIRNAALSWPMPFLANLDCAIIKDFLEDIERFGGRWLFAEDHHKRTFMLLVAEELDGGIGESMSDRIAAMLPGRTKGPQ